MHVTNVVHLSGKGSFTCILAWLVWIFISLVAECGNRDGFALKSEPHYTSYSEEPGGRPSTLLSATTVTSTTPPPPRDPTGLTRRVISTAHQDGRARTVAESR